MIVKPSFIDDLKCWWYQFRCNKRLGAVVLDDKLLWRGTVQGVMLLEKFGSYTKRSSAFKSAYCAVCIVEKENIK